MSYEKVCVAVKRLSAVLSAVLAALFLVGSQASASSLEDLVTSMEGYLCTYPQTNESQTLLFYDADGTKKFMAIGAGVLDQAEASETPQGYRLTVANSDVFFLSKLDTDWRLFGASAKGPVSAECQNLAELPRTLLQVAYGLVEESIAEDRVEALRIADAAAQKAGEAEQEARKLRVRLAELRAKLRESNEIIENLRPSGEIREDATASPGNAFPSLTSSEKDALRVAIQQCWDVGALSSAALRVTVTVSVTMLADGRPNTASIRQVSATGGSGDAVRQAYEAARRAIIRCGARGYDLPAEKFDQWREIEMVFNPERMDIK